MEEDKTHDDQEIFVVNKCLITDVVLVDDPNTDKEPIVNTLNPGMAKRLKN